MAYSVLRIDPYVIIYDKKKNLPLKPADNKSTGAEAQALSAKYYRVKFLRIGYLVNANSMQD
jgi:hypothetical protein